MKLGHLGDERGPRVQQPFHDGGQRRLTRHQLANPDVKGLARDQPRRMPRMLSSMSISLPSRVLRAVMMARTSCEGRVLQWTGRYHPMRKSCAIPRASRRSVFTVIADNAAFTCRVSSRTTSKPACVKAACSHCDKGPASSPMRTTLISSDEK